MKKIFLSILGVLSLANSISFAACPNQSSVYRSEEDDNGVNLPLAFECASAEGNYCLYTDGRYATVIGVPFATTDLYRQKVLVDQNKTLVALKTSVVDSATDYRFVNFVVNQPNLEGSISYGGRGWDPYRGIIILPKTTVQVKCIRQ